MLEANCISQAVFSRESFSDVQKNVFGVVLQFLELSVTKLIIEGNAGILQSQSNFWNTRK